MSFGIALAGGGVKGAAHVGVLLALEENGLKPDAISGSSAGSIVAGLYALGMPACELKNIVSLLSKKGKYFIDADILGILKAVPELLTPYSLSLTGLIKGDKIEKYLCEITGNKNICEVPMKIVIPAVDINSGKTIAYTNNKFLPNTSGDIIWETNIKLCEAIRASSAFPGIFKPKKINNYCLVDGGVTNVLPVDLLAATGVKNVLAVDLSHEYKNPKNHNFLTILNSSYNIMSKNLMRLTTQCEKFVIKPPLPDDIELLAFEAMEECMQIGYEYTKKLIPEIKKNLFTKEVSERETRRYYYNKSSLKPYKQNL